ncbi:hypothetical protein ACN6LM_003428 [Streptomyces sp. SAS_281]|uniref:hypothetical protein n=1 Tax=Streptomyces sp. SAS_281 TaxID=3412744 RepID=UPI00403CAF91
MTAGSNRVSGLLTWLAHRGVYELWTVVVGIMLLGVGLGVREPLLMSTIRGVVMPLGSVTSGVVSRTSGELWALAVLGVLICPCAVVAARDRVLTTYLDLPDEALDDV